MIVFLTDPTGLSDEATRFYKTMIIEKVMHAHYQMEAGWALTPPSFIMYDSDPKQERWHGIWLSLSQAIQDQAFAAIEASDVVLVMMEGAQVMGDAAAAMGYAHALGKPVLVYKYTRERVVGLAFASVGLLAEHISSASGGGVSTSADELLAELEKQEAYLENARRISTTRQLDD